MNMMLFSSHYLRWAHYFTSTTSKQQILQVRHCDFYGIHYGPLTPSTSAPNLKDNNLQKPILLPSLLPRLPTGRRVGGYEPGPGRGFSLPLIHAVERNRCFINKVELNETDLDSAPVIPIGPQLLARLLGCTRAILAVTWTSNSLSKAGKREDVGRLTCG